MKIKPAVLLCTLLLAACSEKPQENHNNPRHQDEKTLAMGNRIYHEHCAVCHGFSGEGKPGWQQPGADGKLLPPPLDGNGRTWRLSSGQIQHFIRQGSPDGRGNMPAWQDKLSEREITAVSVWITSLWPDRVYLDWQTKAEHGAQ